MTINTEKIQAIDLARKKVITCSLNQTIPDVARLMKENWISSVIVVEQDRPVGIITDGIIFDLIANKRNPLTLLVKDIMVTVFTIHKATNINDSEDQFLKTKVKRLAVVDDDGHLVGVLSKKVIDRYTHYSLAQRILHQKKYEPQHRG
ncbi:MAG: CBS domain-containing protein [Candidatus Hodarchaeota archaeon]